MLNELANRRLLTRKVAGRFVMFSHYRRLIMAMLIIGLYNFPIMQLITNMILQLVYLTCLMNYTIYHDPIQAR